MTTKGTYYAFNIQILMVAPDKAVIKIAMPIASDQDIAATYSMFKLRLLRMLILPWWISTDFYPNNCRLLI